MEFGEPHLMIDEPTPRAPPKGSPFELAGKEIGNSFYGKVAQGIQVECRNTKSLYDLQVKTAGVAASNAKFGESVAKIRLSRSPRFDVE